MPTIEIDDSTAIAIRLAAQTAGISPGDVVRRLVEGTHVASGPGADLEVADRIAIHAVYEGHRTNASYNPATQQVEILDGPLEGSSYRSPSGAAIAVVQHYRPTVNPNRNGWTFWTLSDNGQALQSIRHS